MKATEAIHRLPFSVKFMIVESCYPDLTPQTVRLLARGTGNKMLTALIKVGFEPA